MKTPTITRATRRLAASLAIITALATTGAWAGYVWTGEGADEYYGTSGNLLNGPAGRGVYFVDGIEDNQGDMRNASNWTVRFKSYQRIAGAPIYVGRACLTDSDKIWTVISDNDDCGFYLDSGYNLEIGRNTSESNGCFRIMNGKYAVNNVYIGQNANNPTVEGVLSIGSAGHVSSLTAAGNVEIRNGALTTINTDVTCNNLTPANKTNASATIDKTGGDWFVNGDLRMNSSDGSTATFYNRGGNLVVTNDLTVQDRGSGEFYMEGGHVTVSNIVRFGDWVVPANGIANLYLNGGVFEAKTFRFHNSNGPYGYVVFNGGTYKAMADGSVAATDGRLGAVARLYFKVGERGGTIDTAGHDVVFPLRLLQDGSSTGGMTYKGGNTITLTGAANYTGGTTIEGGTCVVVADRAAATALIGSALKVTLPATQLLAGSHALVTITGTEAEDVFTAEDVAKVAFASGVKVSGCYSFALSSDRKSLVIWAPDRGDLSQNDAKLVFPGKTLADLATHTLRARMEGSRFDADGVEVTFFGRDEKRDVDNNLTNVTYQLQTLDEVSGYHYTKSTKVEFTADVDGVWAKIASEQFTNYGAQNAFGTDPLMTNQSANKYIPYDLRIVEPVTNSINVNFTYNNNNLNTSSSVRYGGGDYAVPYSAWENMSAANGSATIGGATWTISNGAGHCGSTSLSATKDLRHGYIGDSDTYTTPTVTVTYVPYEAYRVVVYASAQDDDSIYGHVTVNGRNYTASGDALNSDTGDSVTTVEGDGTWGKDNAGSGSHAYGLKEGLNYLVSYVTGGTTATIVGHRTATTIIHGGIAAIQIVKVDALEDGDILPLKVENGSLERTSMSVALPTVGAATLNITGGRLGSGNHVLFTGVAADALDHLTVNIAPEVIDGRKYSLKVDGSNLVLNIVSPGLSVFVR